MKKTTIFTTIVIVTTFLVSCGVFKKTTKATGETPSTGLTAFSLSDSSKQFTKKLAIDFKIKNFKSGQFFNGKEDSVVLRLIEDINSKKSSYINENGKIVLVETGAPPTVTIPILWPGVSLDNDDADSIGIRITFESNDSIYLRFLKKQDAEGSYGLVTIPVKGSPYPKVWYNNNWYWVMHGANNTLYYYEGRENPDGSKRIPKGRLIMDKTGQPEVKKGTNNMYYYKRKE